MYSLRVNNPQYAIDMTTPITDAIVVMHQAAFMYHGNTWQEPVYHQNN